MRVKITFTKLDLYDLAMAEAVRHFPTFRLVGAINQPDCIEITLQAKQSEDQICDHVNERQIHYAEGEGHD